MNNKNTVFVEIKPKTPPDGLEQVLLDRLPQVRSIARGIHKRLPRNVPLDDLIQAGVLGLIDAFYKFNPAKNVKLASYATFRIRGAILDSLREIDWGPRYLRAEARRVEKARDTLHVRLGRVPSKGDVASEMNMSLEIFQSLEVALHGLSMINLDPQLIDAQISEKPNKPLSAPIEMDPFSMCFRSEMKFYIERAQDKFIENERRVLTLYYFKEFTMKEVARDLGLSESRVSQIHSKAIIHLREALGNVLTVANSMQPKRTASIQI